MTERPRGAARAGPPARGAGNGRRRAWLLPDLVGAAGLDTVAPLPPTPVTALALHSGEVRPGTVFVAIPGTRQDGHAFVAEAVARGASAVVVEREVEVPPGIVAVRVDDTRCALAELAAAFHGRPGDRAHLVAITGTVGKTSVLSLLDAVLATSGIHAGSIGSLGVRLEGERGVDTPHTTPDALRLQEELAGLVNAGSDLVAMEVTSHALVQRRVHGLEYALGVFTNLLPLEHEDYHGSFRAYVEAKSRLFDQLAPGAPLVFNGDDRAVRTLARGRDVARVGVSFRRAAAVRAHSFRSGTERTLLTLDVRRSLPRVGGGEVAPQELAVTLRLHGPGNVTNAALAGVAGLCLGAAPHAVRDALAGFRPPRRRMQILHRGRFTVLDDTVGHPDSVSAVFRTVRRLRPRRLHVAFAVRGRRGEEINRHLAEALAIWAARFPVETLVVTSSTDAVGEGNRVSDGEREAFLKPLRRAGLHPHEEPSLRAAVTRVLGRAGEGDLVLLLGAQGMNGGARVARRWIRARG